jgi:hypothetical protein
MLSDEKLLEIIREIYHHMMHADSTTDFGKWVIGITLNPDKIKIDLKIKANENHFKSWNLEDNITANVVKTSMTGKGCKEVKSANNTIINMESAMREATFVYVYKNE